jgi:hypothetical protein
MQVHADQPKYMTGWFDERNPNAVGFKLAPLINHWSLN